MYSAHSVLAETFSIVKALNSGYLFKATFPKCDILTRISNFDNFTSVYLQTYYPTFFGHARFKKNT